MIKSEEKLYDLKKSLEYLIEDLKSYDDYVYGHCERVANYSKMIAEKMGLHSYECEQLHLGALLHDVGKLKISKEILGKPGRLNYDEYCEVKKHSSLGYEVLIDTHLLNDYPIILNIALAHHERLDGTGYPFGLKGNDLPLETRIVAIADSFDAMTSKRNYKTNMTKKEALNELRNCKSMYDQELVQALDLALNQGGI